MLRCMIFDMDGTTGDTLPLCIRAFRLSIEALAGRRFSDREIVETFGPSEEGTIAALVPGRVEEGMALFRKHYAALHREMCPAPFPGIPELLDLLRRRGIRTAMVTGKGRRTLDMTLDVFGGNSWFSWIETGNPSGPSKPAGIRRVLEGLSVAPEEAAYVGDVVSDIAAARETGVQMISAAWAPGTDAAALRAHHPDHLFETVEALRQWVERLP